MTFITTKVPTWESWLIRHFLARRLQREWINDANRSKSEDDILHGCQFRRNNKMADDSWAWYIVALIKTTRCFLQRNVVTNSLAEHFFFLHGSRLINYARFRSPFRTSFRMGFTQQKGTFLFNLPLVFTSRRWQHISVLVFPSRRWQQTERNVTGILEQFQNGEICKIAIPKPELS